jgi:hypothetical protein
VGVFKVGRSVVKLDGRVPPLPASNVAKRYFRSLARASSRPPFDPIRCPQRNLDRVLPRPESCPFTRKNAARNPRGSRCESALTVGERFNGPCLVICLFGCSSPFLSSLAL